MSRSPSTPASPPSAPPADALAILKQDCDELARYFEQLLHRYAGAPQRLIDAIRYSLLAGGKRLRPALLLETFRCVAGPAHPHHAGRQSALAAAGAIELIHTFSLVHDDLPAMDDDDLRRGVPTNHKVFGEALAILAGDAMVTMAFELLATQADASRSPKLILELASASGPEGMIGGQVLDIEGENKSLQLHELQRLHAKKTGALLTCACRMGAIAAVATESQLQAVTDFGRHLGLAFQIVDDLLDVTATPEQLGKATGKDAAKGKNTYPTLLGIDGSKKEAQAQLQAALEATNTFGASGDGLRALCRFVVERQN